MLTYAQIQSMEAALVNSQQLAWHPDRREKPQRILDIQYAYVDPEDLEPIPVPVAWMEGGKYIDLNNTDPHDIVVVEISRFF